MKEKKRILYEETELDSSTGEVLKRKTSLQFPKEPAYVKLYFDCLGVVIQNDGLNESLNDMLLEVLKMGSYADEDQTVTLTSYQKKKICDKTNAIMFISRKTTFHFMDEPLQLPYICESSLPKYNKINEYDINQTTLIEV